MPMTNAGDQQRRALERPDPADREHVPSAIPSSTAGYAQMMSSTRVMIPSVMPRK